MEGGVSVSQRLTLSLCLNRTTGFSTRSHVVQPRDLVCRPGVVSSWAQRPYMRPVSHAHLTPREIAGGEGSISATWNYYDCFFFLFPFSFFVPVFRRCHDVVSALWRRHVPAGQGPLACKDDFVSTDLETKAAFAELEGGCHNRIRKRCFE